MKVLHAAAEIAGQASILCRALRELGVDATALAYNAQYPVYPTDILLPYDGKPRVPRLLGYLKTAARFTGRYDLIHVHFGRGLVPPWNPDLPVHRALGTKLVFHFHGCDVRNRAMMLARHASAACTECEPFCVPERQRRVTQPLSTGDVPLDARPARERAARRAPASRARRGGVGYRAGSARAQRRPLVVLHVRQPPHQGNALDQQGVAAAAAKDPRITWRLLESARGRTRSAMAEADIVVDQCSCWYGLVAARRWRSGRSWGSSAKDFGRSRGRSTPLVRATKDDVGSPSWRTTPHAPRAGEAGRAYARPRPPPRSWHSG
jgi:hypothetical protein